MITRRMAEKGVSWAKLINYDDNSVIGELKKLSMLIKRKLNKSHRY